MEAESKIIRVIEKIDEEKFNTRFLCTNGNRKILVEIKEGKPQGRNRHIFLNLRLVSH